MHVVVLRTEPSERTCHEVAAPAVWMIAPRERNRILCGICFHVRQRIEVSPWPHQQGCIDRRLQSVDIRQGLLSPSRSGDEMSAIGRHVAKRLYIGVYEI